MPGWSWEGCSECEPEREGGGRQTWPRVPFPVHSLPLTTAVEHRCVFSHPHHAVSSELSIPVRSKRRGQSQQCRQSASFKRELRNEVCGACKWRVTSKLQQRVCGGDDPLVGREMMPVTRDKLLRGKKKYKKLAPECSQQGKYSRKGRKRTTECAVVALAEAS